MAANRPPTFGSIHVTSTLPASAIANNTDLWQNLSAHSFNKGKHPAANMCLVTDRAMIGTGTRSPVGSRGNSNYETCLFPSQGFDDAPSDETSRSAGVRDWPDCIFRTGMGRAHSILLRRRTEPNTAACNG